jgi:hypothetical protein
VTGQSICVGTDDMDGLTDFLRSKVVYVDGKNHALNGSE